MWLLADAFPAGPQREEAAEDWQRRLEIDTAP